MKYFKILAFIFYLFLSSTITVSQSLKDFDNVLSKGKIGKVFTKKVGKDISERTLLGTVKDENGQVKYYVVIEFLRIQAAIVYHGHSSILFFNNKKKLVHEAILSLPEELPYKLDADFLYFKYSENGATKNFKQKIKPLPKMICVEPRSCYSVTIPWKDN